MSDFHVLEINDRKDKAKIVFHFTTPVGNNAAGVSYAAALVEWKAPQTVIPNLGAEAANISDGSIIEYVETVQFNAAANNATKLAVVSSRWTALNATIPARIQENLRFWGHSGDVS